MISAACSPTMWAPSTLPLAVSTISLSSTLGPVAGSAWLIGRKRARCTLMPSVPWRAMASSSVRPTPDSSGWENTALATRE